MAFSAQTNRQGAVPADFESVYQKVSDLSRLQNEIASGDFGRDYGGLQRKAAISEYQRLGGDQAIQQIMSDPRYGEQIRQRISAESSGNPMSVRNITPTREQALHIGRSAALLALPVAAGAMTGAGAAGAAGTGASGTFMPGVGELGAGSTFGSTIGATGTGAGGIFTGPLAGYSTGLGAGATGAGLASAAVPAAASIIPAAAVPTAAATGGLFGLSGNTLGALALGGASLYGSRQSRKTAERAGDIQAEAAKRALTEQSRQFDIGRAGQQPYMRVGREALAEERALMGLGGEDPRQRLRELMQAPGTQFRMNQGQRALDASASSRGGVFSGRAGKEMTRYGQGFASTEYGNRLAQLGNVAQRGQSAASGMANLGANYATNVGNLYTGMGANQAGSEIAQEQARQSGLIGVATAADRLFNPPRQQLTLQDLMAQR